MSIKVNKDNSNVPHATKESIPIFSYNSSKDIFECYIHIISQKEYINYNEIKEYFEIDPALTEYFHKNNMVHIKEYKRNFKSYININKKRLEDDEKETENFNKNQYIEYERFLNYVLNSIPQNETHKIYHYAQQLKYGKKSMLHKFYDSQNDQLLDEAPKKKSNKFIRSYVKKIETYCFAYLLVSGFFVEYDLKYEELNKESMYKKLEEHDQKLSIKFQNKWNHFKPDCSIEICPLTMKEEKQWNLLVIETNEDYHKDRLPEDDKIKKEFLKALGYEYIQINIRRDWIENSKDNKEYYKQINKKLEGTKSEIKLLISRRIKQLYNIEIDRDDIIRRIQSLEIDTDLFDNLELSLNNCYEFNIDHNKMMILLEKTDENEMKRSILGQGKDRKNQLISDEYLKFEFLGYTPKLLTVSEIPPNYTNGKNEIKISNKYKIVTNLLGFIEYCINCRNDIAKTIVLNIIRLLDLQQQLLKDYMMKEKMIDKNDILNITSKATEKEKQIIKTKNERIDFIAEDDERSKICDELLESKEENEKLSNKLKFLENEINNKTIRLKNAEDEINKLNEKLTTINERKEYYKKQNNSLNNQIKEIKDEYSTLEEEKENLEIENKKLKEDSEKENKRLKKKNKDLEKQIKERDQTIEEYNINDEKYLANIPKKYYDILVEEYEDIENEWKEINLIIRIRLMEVMNKKDFKIKKLKNFGNNSFEYDGYKYSVN